MASDDEKLAELRAIVEGIRDRVRSQFPDSSVALETGSGEPIRVPLADLMPVVHARDAAQAKMAAIGTVNPRRGGLANNAIQSVKRGVARGLGWFVRDQIVFNRGTLACIDALTESLNELNRSIASLASQLSERLTAEREAGAREVQAALAETRRLAPLSALLTETQRSVRDVERKLAQAEAAGLRRAGELQAAYENRNLEYRELINLQHGDFSAALDRGLREIQERLWEDMARIRQEFERTIHTELRTVRQRGAGVEPHPAPLPLQEISHFDYGAFSKRFRGSEEYVRAGQQFYVERFRGASEVLDIGCGRGEFLRTMRDNGIAARGIDLSEECVAYCRSQGLNAEKADLFRYLADLPDASLPAIFSAQVVEHLPPARLPEMITLCARKLERDGPIALETPNPECLAIFASHFFLDPTHTRPAPHPLLAFLLEEAGMGGIEVHKRFPAADTWPELNELPPGVRDRFFGGLDYAIFARKL